MHLVDGKGIQGLSTLAPLRGPARRVPTLSCLPTSHHCQSWSQAGKQGSKAVLPRALSVSDATTTSTSQHLQQEAVQSWLQRQAALPQDTWARTHTVSYPVSWEASGQAAGQLSISGVRVSTGSDGVPAALLVVVATLKEPQQQLYVHWACVGAPGRSWSPPPAGWHTHPSISHDAGSGAWQTQMARVQDESKLGPAAAKASSSQQQHVHVAVIQVPLIGPLRKRKSGIVLVLTTGSEWLKQSTPSMGQGDFFFATQDLPATLSGALHDARGRHAPSPAPSTQPPHMSHPPGIAEHGSATTHHHPAMGPTSKTAGVEAARATSVGVEAARDLSVDSVAAQPRGEKEKEEKEKEVDHHQAGVGELPPQVAQLGVPSVAHLQQFLADFHYTQRHPSTYTIPGTHKEARLRANHGMVDAIAKSEHGAQRSLMHRFNQAADFVEQAATSYPEGKDRLSALAAIAVWLRFSALRLLVWNRNYNIKPREISTAQDRLCTKLSEVWASAAVGHMQPGTQQPHSQQAAGGDVRPVVALALAAVGRGGTGDVGQRVRDEILEVQSRNHCKGGMMEEWHQKLHNNTSPDDIAICEALLAYCQSGLDIKRYWSTLAAANIDAARLASFDRAIRSEPHFSPGQVPGLIKDLTAYLQTLKAVHGGTDLATAARNVLGYTERSMKGSKPIVVPAVPSAASPRLRDLLAAALYLQHQRTTKQATPHVPAAGNSAAGGVTSQATAAAAAGEGEESVKLLQLLLEARHALRHYVLGGDGTCGGRHRDVLFLDTALEAAFRTAVEGMLGSLRHTAAAASSIPLATTPSACASTQQPEEGRAATPESEHRGTTADFAARQAGAGSQQPASQEEARIHNEGGPPPAATQLLLLLRVTSLAAENAALSSYPNEDLTWAVKWLTQLQHMKGPYQEELLQCLSVSERLKRALEAQCGALAGLLQPTADLLGTKLGVAESSDGPSGRGRAASVAAIPLSHFSEEVVRGTAAAPLSQLLGLLEPCVRKLAGGGDWQVVSRCESAQGVVGTLVVEQQLEAVQYKTYPQPTVLLVEQLAGHEEVPEGCVAVLSAAGQCPDTLSHSAVRARNMGVVLAACHSPQEAQRLKGLAGQQVRVQLQGQDVQVEVA